MIEKRLTTARYTDACVGELLDVACAPTDHDPVRRLGFLPFHYTPNAPGKFWYTRSFASRTLPIWGRR